MLTIIYISGYLPHVFKVSQNRREEEAVGSCPKKAGHCSAVSTSVVRTLTGRGRLSGLKMVLCQQYSTSQLIFKGYVYHWPTRIQGV